MNAPIIFAFERQGARVRNKDEIQMIREEEQIGFREEQWA